MSEWQPIETAPRDGTIILVWDDDGKEVTVANYSEVNGCWIDCISAEDADEAHETDHDPWTLVGWRCYTPTHWMPLPEPPEDA